ncbi:S8 family serine peptidase [Streptomonospora sediminis]
MARAACAAAVLALALPTAPAVASPSAPASPSPSTNPSSLPQVSVFPGTDAECVQSSATITRTPWTEVSLGLERARELDEGAGTTVAVLAPGVSADGPALSGAVTGGGGDDCHGYGTFLAGIVAARPVPGSGITGVAPAAEVVGVATGDTETGVATADQIASSIGDSVDAGADVVLVGTAAGEGSGALDDAVAAATEADVLVVAPATTVNSQGDPVPGHPAQHGSALSVGSFDPNGAPVAASPVPMPDGEGTARTDVTAPGALVVGVGPDGGHYMSSGDGTAAAFAAGTAALVRSHAPDLSAAQVRERLMATAYGPVMGADSAAVGRGPIDPVAALTNSPEDRPTPAAVSGNRFTATPPSASWDPPTTIAVSGVSALLVIGCAMGAVVLRRGRSRSWRPAAAGEEITPAGDGSEHQGRPNGRD